MSLKVIKLSKEYTNKKVVNKVSLVLEKGETLGLLGPNGAGKTTLFYMVAGLIRPDEGEVFINEICLTEKGIAERSKLGISYLPQESSVFRKLSVEENILSALEQRFNQKDPEIKKELDVLIKEFNLSKLRSSKAIKLSGGERRRVEIARSLASNPNFLLLDEPFAGIDPIAVSELKEIFKDLNKRDIGILISDHNVRETMKICDRVLILNQGEEIAEGPPAKISKDKLVKEVYLGKDF